MGAAGNGEQVILSLGAGDLEEGVGGDAARMGEYLAAISSSLAKCWITSNGA